MNENSHLNGLGGWLILIGLGLVISPFRLVATTVPVFKTIFEDGIWTALTTLGSEAYHVLWGPILIGEIVLNIIMLLVSIYLIYLFFSKHHYFPNLYIAFLLLPLFITLIDVFAISLIVPEQSVFTSETNIDLLKLIGQCLIWIPYMLVSKRVKATFTLKKPGDNIMSSELSERSAVISYSE